LRCFWVHFLASILHTLGERHNSKAFIHAGIFGHISDPMTHVHVTIKQLTYVANDPRHSTNRYCLLPAYMYSVMLHRRIGAYLVVATRFLAKLGKVKVLDSGQKITE